MNEEKQLSELEKLPEFVKLNEAINHRAALAGPSPKEPKKIAAEILYFRNHYKELDLLAQGAVQFYTYDLELTSLAVDFHQAVKALWERDNTTLAAKHVVTLSVYPAMMEDKDGKYILNFYFIPTWIESGALEYGGHIKKDIIDFVDILTDRNSPYPNYIGYIYDLGSSCP